MTKNIVASANIQNFGIKPYKATKTEEYMNTKQLAHFQLILEKWREQLQEEIKSTTNSLKNDENSYADPVDQASQLANRQISLKNSDRARKLIRRINEALEEIKISSYGYCIDCGEEIGILRLEARPIAIQCVECKSIEELREKQTGKQGE